MSHQTVTQEPHREMSSKLLDCCKPDMKACCMGYWCLPCLMCSNATRLGESACVCCCTASSVALRSKLRAKYAIKGSMMKDYCAAMCCGACFECQTRRELDHLGVPN